MKNLIYIFDNYTFNNANNNTINTLKRWVTYNLHILSKDDNYDKITLIKTGPNILKCSINIKKDNSVNKVLEIINGIIYKKYGVYPTINFKLLAETIDEINEFDSEIFIFTSMVDAAFTQSIKDFINNIFEKFTNKINIINIAKYEYLQLNFKNINEFYIDHRTNKIEEIIKKEVFVINQYNSELFNYKEFLEKDKIHFLRNFIDVLYNIELYILIGESKEDIHNEIVKILSIDITKFIENKTIINIFKNYVNQVKKFFEKKYSICSVTVPIKTLDEKLLETYIKYILEFYEETYPKIVNYYTDTNIKNYKIPTTTTKKITLQMFDKINKIDPDTILDTSKEFLVSNATMSNWIDEFNEFNPFGILVKYNISKFGFKGLIDENSNIHNTYPNMVISSVSNNWVSMYDYYQMVLAELNNTNEMDDNFMDKNKLELNKFNIVDKLNGDTNIMLPIYINKKHWELTRILWSYHLSFINNTFEFDYNKKMDNIYYFILLKSYNNFSDDNKLNSNFIRTFIYILRTCIQISLDNYYITNIKNETNKYFNYIKNINNGEDKSYYFKRYFIDYLIRLLQLFVSSNSDINEVKTQLIFIRNFIIQLYLNYNYTPYFWENLMALDEEKRNLEINIIKNECIQNSKSYFDLEIDLIGLCEFVNKLYKLKNFNQFHKTIDKFNGCIPNDGIDSYITCDIIISTYINLTNPKVFIIDNYIDQIDIDKYINEIITLKKLENTQEMIEENTQEMIEENTQEMIEEKY